MESIWKELKTFRTASSRITSELLGSQSKIVLRKVNQIASGQLHKIGPDVSVSSVYAISVESNSVESDTVSPATQLSENISLIKQIILDHDGDILDSSPFRIVACWMPTEQSKHSVVARLAIQAALNISATMSEQIVCCVSYGKLNHAMVGGVCSQFLPFIYGEVIESLGSGNVLARSQGRPFVFSNIISALNPELLSMLSNTTVISDRFSSCSIPSAPLATVSKSSFDSGCCIIQQDLTSATHQLILNCIPYLSLDRKAIQWKHVYPNSAFISICVKIKFDSILQPIDSEIASSTTESFSCFQSVVASVQTRCFAGSSELWRIIADGAAAFIFIASWFEEQGDLLSIQGMVSLIVHDLNAMRMNFSIGIDSKPGKIFAYGPDTRSSVFIESDSICISEKIANSCPWNHLQTNFHELFPTSAHISLSESTSPNLSQYVQHVVNDKKPDHFFERQEALSSFQEYLEGICRDPHQGVLAICGCFGSGKSYVINSMQLASEFKGIRSLRCRPETRNSAPLAPFILILSHLLDIDLLSATKQQKLQKCRTYVRTQMLADERDVALLGVVLDFTLENDLLEGLAVSEVLEELKSVISRALYALGSSSSPFILFIENMYCLDSFSWDLLMDLASKKVNVVCEALNAYDADIFALEMKTLLRHSCVTKLSLSTVSLEVFEDFLCRKFACDRVNAEVTSYLRTQCGGRNLFANEWSDFMMRNQSLTLDNGELIFSGEYCLSVNPVVPHSIQSLIEEDFDRLEEVQQLFLKIVAILGRCFTLEDVCFLSRNQNSKSFAASTRTSTEEARATHELCVRLCELGFLRPDFESRELLTVTYVSPSLLTASGDWFCPVLHTQKAAGLDCSSVLFWCFQSHVVQNIILGLLKNDQLKAVSMKIAHKCQYDAKALTSQSQELAKSSFTIARHLFQGGNFIDALSVIHTLSAASIYSYIRENVFHCFPPPAAYAVNEAAYIASRMFLVPWICEFCRSIEAINPFKARSASPVRSIVSPSKSSSSQKLQGNFQDFESKMKSELSSASIKSSSNRLTRLTDPPKRLARCGGLAPVASQQPMLSGASIWGQGEKAWRSQTLLHHPDPEPNVTTLLKGSSLTKKIPVIHSLRHITFAYDKYKTGPGPRFDAIVKDLEKFRIKVQTREHQRHYKWQDDALANLMSSNTSIVGPQWSVASAVTAPSPPASPLAKSRAASPDRSKLFTSHGESSGK